MLHGYISKLSLNARKYSNQTMESLEIYLETNAYGPDPIECDARLAQAIIGKHKLLKLNQYYANTVFLSCHKSFNT